MLLLFETSAPNSRYWTLVVLMAILWAHRCAALNLHLMISCLLGHISVRPSVNFFLIQCKESLVFVQLVSEVKAVS